LKALTKRWGTEALVTYPNSSDKAARFLTPSLKDYNKDSGVIEATDLSKI